MRVLRDVRRFGGLVGRILRRRRLAATVRGELARRGPLEPGLYEIAVYFADGDVNMYQLRQWYRPLERLARTHPVLVVARNPVAAHLLLDETDLAIAYAPTVAHLERLVAQQPMKIVLYVNQNMRNFQMLRYGRRWHVYINHGESDKMYMTTNQFKAYDYALVAGEAARERLSRALWNYDVEARTIAIGRPQADYVDAGDQARRDDRMVVLYAPTWEGDRPAARYGSVESHGVALVRSLLATGRHRVIYRPHPRTGVVDDGYRRADARIEGMIRAANEADASAGHLVDRGPELGWQLAVADVAIVDISAMVYDRLAQSRPLLVTRPAAAEAEIDETGYLGECRWLRVEDAERAVEVVDGASTDAAALADLERWARHHFGDTAPGAPTARLEAAIDLLLARWAEQDARAEGDRQRA